MCADIVVQPLPADRFAEFDAVIMAAFGAHPDPRKKALVDGLQPADRRLVALDGDRPVGTAAAFSFAMTVPGGAELPVAGVTAVGVLGTHRRRGILRQLMAVQLDDIARRGESVAVLTASESGIYRRFGYGIGSFNAAYELESRRIGFDGPVGADLDLTLLRGDEATPVVAPIYERWRATRPGALAYTPAWWNALLGAQESYIGGGQTFVVVCEPRPGHGGGFAIYRTDFEPGGRFAIDLRLLVATDPVVEARLWRYLVEIDLSETVRAELVPVDCPLRWWVTDPRQVRTVTLRDWLHVRVLDVPAALTARRYAVDDGLTIGVCDTFRPGPATDGRFVVAARHGEGRCERTGDEPDLTLDIAALGSMYLGGVRATELAAAGLVTQRTPGALARADALFGWPAAPFCPTHF
jgi:predicted acetyltransferase